MKVKDITFQAKLFHLPATISIIGHKMYNLNYDLYFKETEQYQHSTKASRGHQIVKLFDLWNQDELQIRPLFKSTSERKSNLQSINSKLIFLCSVPRQ